MFDHIYGDKNEKEYTDDELTRRLCKEAMRMLEPGRKDRRDELVPRLVCTYSWLNALATRLEIDLQDALWLKYPGVCSYCFKETHCLCGTEHPLKFKTKEEKNLMLRPLLRSRNGREPQTLHDHQEFHRRLYFWQHETEDPLRIIAHVAEEADEIDTELWFWKSAKAQNDREEASKRILETQNEIADMAGWVLTLANRLRIDFADTVWSLYPYECMTCHSDVCTCPHKVI